MLGRRRDREEDARRRLKSTLAWRFPGDGLLFITESRVDRLPTRGEWALGLAGRAHCIGGACINDPTYRDREAVLGVTRTRLVYQTLGPHGLLLRGAATGAVLLAFILLVVGSPAGFFWCGLVSAGLWILSRVTEAFGIGTGNIDFPHVMNMDARSQTIEGVGRWGTMYRMRIPNASDFRLIRAMAGPAGTANAA